VSDKLHVVSLRTELSMDNWSGFCRPEAFAVTKTNGVVAVKRNQITDANQKISPTPDLIL